MVRFYIKSLLDYLWLEVATRAKPGFSLFYNSSFAGAGVEPATEAYGASREKPFPTLPRITHVRTEHTQKLYNYTSESVIVKISDK